MNGEELRAIRLRLRLTQAQMSFMVGLCPRQLARLEKSSFINKAIGWVARDLEARAFNSSTPNVCKAVLGNRKHFAELYYAKTPLIHSYIVINPKNPKTFNVLIADVAIWGTSFVNEIEWWQSCKETLLAELTATDWRLV